MSKNVQQKEIRPSVTIKPTSKTPGGQTNSIDGKKVSPPPKKS